MSRPRCPLPALHGRSQRLNQPGERVLRRWPRASCPLLPLAAARACVHRRLCAHAEGKEGGQMRRAIWDSTSQDAAAFDTGNASETMDIGVGVVVPSSEGQLMQGGKIRLRLSIRLHFGLDGESEDLQASMGASMGGTGGSRLRRTESLGRTGSGATGADPSAAPIMRLAVPLLQVEVSASSACALCDCMAHAPTRAARSQYLRCELRRDACYWLLALPCRGSGNVRIKHHTSACATRSAHQHVGSISACIRRPCVST